MLNKLTNRTLGWGFTLKIKISYTWSDSYGDFMQITKDAALAARNAVRSTMIDTIIAVSQVKPVIWADQVEHNRGSSTQTVLTVCTGFLYVGQRGLTETGAVFNNAAPLFFNEISNLFDAATK